MGDALPGRTPAEQVYRFWLGYQRRPRLCKLTDARRKLIRRALADYEVEDLVALVRYAYEASEPGPKFWRGDNRTGRTYLDLTNLLSDAKRLPGRVEAAVAWVEEGQGEEEVEDPTATLAALARRAPGSATTRATKGSGLAAAKRLRRRPRWE